VKCSYYLFIKFLCKTTRPILSFPQLGRKFILDTDASDLAVGAVLSQEDDEGQERVIAYMGKGLNNHEQSYCVTRKELLAVVVALKKFHTYLYSQHVLLRTDNSAVSWVRNFKVPTGQMARWLQELFSYNLEVEHCKGRKHSNADALSRSPCKVCARYAEEPDTIVEMDTLKACEDTENKMVKVRRVTTRSSTQPQTPVLLEGWEPSTLRDEKLKDADIGDIMQSKEMGERPIWGNITDQSPEYKNLWCQWDRLEVVNGLLCRQKTLEDGESNQFVVPKSMQSKVLLTHNIPSAAHPGWRNTLKKTQTNFYWPKMKDNSQAFCLRCDACASRKPSRASNRAPLGQQICGGPMERVSIDILGPLPTTENGNRYVLVMMNLRSGLKLFHYQTKKRRQVLTPSRKISFQDLAHPLKCILIKAETLNPNCSKTCVKLLKSTKPEQQVSAHRQTVQ